MAAGDYENNPYLGPHANDAAATAEAVARGWDVAGTPFTGLYYLDTSLNIFKSFDGALWRPDGSRQIQVIYFGKHGNDTYDGNSEESAVLTIAQAHSRASTLSPSINNQIVLVCLDDGQYTENVTGVSYVHINAPNAIIDGDHAMAPNTFWNVGQIISPGSLLIAITSAGNYYLKAKNMTAIASQNGVIQANGDLIAEIGSFTVNSAFAFIISGAGTVKAKVGRVSITSTGYAFAIAAAAPANMDVSVEEISGSGTAFFAASGAFINARAGRSIAVGLANVASPSAVNLIAGYATGSVSGEAYFHRLIVGGNSHTALELGNHKVMFTPEGGLAVKLINNTGRNSIKGLLVEASSAINEAVVAAGVSSYDPIGAMYENGIPNGQPVWVVVAGVAQVLLEDGTTATRGYWAATPTVTGGRADITTAAPPGLVLQHFREIGHGLETVASGTDVLAKIMMHFN